MVLLYGMQQNFPAMQAINVTIILLHSVNYLSLHSPPSIRVYRILLANKRVVSLFDNIVTLSIFFHVYKPWKHSFSKEKNNDDLNFV